MGRPRLATRCSVEGCSATGKITRNMCQHHYMQWYAKNRSPIPVPVRHGHARKGRVSAEWKIWQRMKRRCLNKTALDYPRYGGRGITVCERWQKFDLFIRDMGLRPSPAHSIDRIDNDGNYEPGNCRWATRHEQDNNKRNNRILTLNGDRLTIAQWSLRLGIKPSTVRTRLGMGWSDERVLTEPVGLVGKNQYSNRLAEKS